MNYDASANYTRTWWQLRPRPCPEQQQQLGPPPGQERQQHLLLARQLLALETQLGGAVAEEDKALTLLWNTCKGFHNKNNNKSRL